MQHRYSADALAANQSPAPFYTELLRRLHDPDFLLRGVPQGLLTPAAKAQLGALDRNTDGYRRELNDVFAGFAGFADWRAREAVAALMQDEALQPTPERQEPDGGAAPHSGGPLHFVVEDGPGGTRLIDCMSKTPRVAGTFAGMAGAWSGALDLWRWRHFGGMPQGLRVNITKGDFAGPPEHSDYQPLYSAGGKRSRVASLGAYVLRIAKEGGAR